MNLGIEDAYVFATCAADALGGRPERLGDYGRLRRAVDARVVADVERLTRLIVRRSAAGDLARRLLLPLFSRSALVRRQVGRQVTGLDHPVLTR